MQINEVDLANFKIAGNVTNLLEDAGHGIFSKHAQQQNLKVVRVEVSGKAHYSGECTFTAEADDPLLPGFLPSFGGVGH